MSCVYVSNPISKIIYHTPNENPEKGLSELFELLGNKVQAKWGQDRIELVTGSENARLQFEFKNGTKREIGIDFWRNTKHALEAKHALARILNAKEDPTKDDFDALMTIAI